MVPINAIFSQRLEDLLKQKDMRKVELAKHLAVERSTVTRYAQGRVPDAETLDKLARLFGVTTDYLLGRTGDPRVTTIALAHNVPSEDTEKITRPEQAVPEKTQNAKGATTILQLTDRLPIVGTIKCGVPLLSEENIVGHIEVPSDIRRRADFALIASGDSMVGAGIQDGDVIFLRKVERGMPGHGDIVAALVNETETTLKYYKRHNGDFYLEPANPAYESLLVDDTVKIQGVYVGMFTDKRREIEPPPETMTEDELITKLARIRGLDPDQVAGMLDVLSKTRR